MPSVRGTKGQLPRPSRVKNEESIIRQHPVATTSQASTGSRLPRGCSGILNFTLTHF